MPFICYQSKRFHPKSEKLISTANDILDEYAAVGLDLTLRQLFFVIVSLKMLSDTPKEYKNFQTLVNDARLAGRIDWNRFQMTPRQGIKNRSVEVWGDNQLLLSVLERASSHKVNFVFCPSHAGNSFLWKEAQRLIEFDKNLTIIWLSDAPGSYQDLCKRMSVFEVENVNLLQFEMRVDLERAEPKNLHESLDACITRNLKKS